MTVWKGAGIGAGVVAGICAAIVALLGPALGASGLTLGVLLTAGLVSGGLWLIASLYDHHLNRLLIHLDALDDAERRIEPTRLRFGLQDVVSQTEAGTRGLHNRVADLIASRRELEVRARLADAERRHLQAILHSISDAVIVTDAFNEIALANGAAGRILGFDATHATHRPIEQVVQDPTLLQLIKDTRAQETADRRHIKHRIATDAGDSAIFDVSLASIMTAPLGGNGHAPVPGSAGVVTVLHDVTREKQIADAKSDFVANVSHELRTPLSSIKAYMEMLVDGEADTEETRAEFYNIIQGETNRLSRLIDNVLNIRRIESGVIKVQREQLSLPKVAQEAVDILLPQANAKQVALSLEPCPQPCQVFADRDMILQSMLNLLSNAIKYTPEGGTIDARFDINRDQGEVTFVVVDTGVGIPEADLPRVYDKFYRVADHKGIAKGTGLGLNLVKHVIETVHAGRVGVHSQIDRGSTFTFTLPIAENN